ncbi:MAG: YebC/PmpR family DNA-binding transcriptional regulator [Candidatus Cyclonatronum sp.]|uniref:YebC/PmpR family DNA-binding transcriptional regulator n=1 Tax=Cyclonatronum sp. TaxID=3024185 RepID=UPI0025BC5B08|nr:YebC/PmpR family DNA-binding transcriptional regulator [Cyclonatronum sp.]MCC5934579.1 YebC/PmpR family DNA-binding transcriptional regulator [Balneolales bacterium]MCH8487382.1 YebC/PmpR family DNA-binding transcriptional regulator [Cyclonatronum sp.]
MAGHSKWANIKHRKARQDAARSKAFTKIIRELTVSAREGGGDPGANPRLSLAIENAKSVNMPKENIERAIKKGTGELEGESYEEVTFEGYGPGGVAYFVECTTDNNNRTVGEIRHAFSRNGGNMGTSGSVAFLFEQKGIISIEKKGLDEDEVMLAAIDAGADDVKAEGDVFEITTTREQLYAVRTGLEEAGYTIATAELQRLPATEVAVDAETAAANLKLMDRFEDLDDVTNVFTNMSMSDEVMSIAENM